MISIKIGDQYLDLAKSGTVSMDINNPMFGAGTIPGSLSYPFSLPANSPTNAKVLGFPEHLARSEKPKTIEGAQLFIEGVLYKTGRLIYRGFDGKNYKYNLSTDTGSIKEQIESMTLGDTGILTTGVLLKDVIQEGFKLIGYNVTNQLVVYGLSNATILDTANAGDIPFTDALKAMQDIYNAALFINTTTKTGEIIHRNTILSYNRAAQDISSKLQSGWTESEVNTIPDEPTQLKQGELQLGNGNLLSLQLEWANWRNLFRNTREVTRKANLSIADLVNLDLSYPVWIKDEIAGTSKWLIQQIKIQASVRDGLKPATLTLYKL
ncbi:hypothetical protein V6R21_07770 [Limibacter armeniacum]|uniref:hypothetical protein n=1 Tax=Limibacter armeniacum TaxID=466084 RepID=UPI002FE5F095